MEGVDFGNVHGILQRHGGQGLCHVLFFMVFLYSKPGKFDSRWDFDEETNVWVISLTMY